MQKSSAPISSRIAMDYDYLFKLVLTGCSSVGKTSLLHRFMDDEFLAVGIPTIGVDFRIKQATIDGLQVKLQIWDSAGQERFQALTRQYYRNASALCVVYDVSDYASFERVADWLAEFELYGCAGAPKYLVGNKNDLPEGRRQVPRQMAALDLIQHPCELLVVTKCAYLVIRKQSTPLIILPFRASFNQGSQYR